MFKFLRKLPAIGLIAILAILAVPAAVLACMPSDGSMLAVYVPINVDDELPGGG